MTEQAFGAPGIPPTWASSDKDLVTTGLGTTRVWVTIGHGIVNEIFWPTTGRPQIRDLSFYLVGHARWIDLKRVYRYRLETPKPYIPLLTIVHDGNDYRLELEILPDPRRDVLLIRYELTGNYRLIAMAAPHLGGSGFQNSAWIDGEAYAQHSFQGHHCLCMTADKPLIRQSAGYVGFSDGWQDLARHGDLTYRFARADCGNVALTAELEGRQGVLALAFSDTTRGARTLAYSALAEGFDPIRQRFIANWQAWGEQLKLPAPTKTMGDLGVLSATVLKVHEDRGYPGALVASLSVPWGSSTDTLGGYHLVWPRDTTLAAFALIAANQVDDAERILAHLIAAQQPDGHWSQNYFPDGEPFWTGIQLDEAAFPVLLAAKLREIGQPDLTGTEQMVHRAIGFVARNGPTSPQDRWEENPGTNPFTLAIAISALIAGAPWLDGEERKFALELADDWNERLESWCYVTETPLAKEAGVDGYYVRIAPPEKDGGISGRVALRNRNGETIMACALVSLDFSYLVRLGLRDPRDPRIADTIKIVDRILKVETPSGPVYHRYNDDGYGEYPDGRPFDGNGIGRGWPLLVGERGHLAMQAGEDPIEYLKTMQRCASPGGLLPEQVWDAAPIPERGLVPGRPSGSAMPLLWTHSEFLKLLVARESSRPAELLQSVETHIAGKPALAATTHWRGETPIGFMPRSQGLVIEDREHFFLHFGWDGWKNVRERQAEPLPFGLWGVRFTPDDIAGHSELNFTRRWGATWEGRDHHVKFVEAAMPHKLTHEQ